jgi:hypothetical protein
MMSQQTADRPRRNKRNLQPADVVEIDFVILGDFAQANAGKLTVVGGGWNVMQGQQYPATVPFGLGIAFLVPWSLTNRTHHFDFVIKKSEGGQLAGGGGDFEVGREPGIPAGMSQRVMMGLAGALQVNEPGTYEIIVTTGDANRTITFEALPIRPSAQRLQ